MTREIEKKIDVIAQNDPFSAQRPHFDFQALRREGLKHIGDLSGKIWTDHNAHDPGVTILEELCYALIDLGYRTTLPMQDLLAQPRDDSPKPTEDDSPRHENFFTPLEILSCNPTTVLDFRKLLLDIDGVRNAWLEPAESDAPLYLYLSEHLENPKPQCCSADESKTRPNQVALNGLYNVLIQKEINFDEEKLFKSVKEMLSAHRNLCEDFSAIRILQSLEVGICADVDLEDTADAATVYEAIIRAVKGYISPEIVYYTLRELLDKGRAIEDIFAGRPKLGSRSAGFVDTEELEALPFRDKLQGSDLYAAILAVKGVLAVRNLSFHTDGTIEGKTIQRVVVSSGSAAVFSLERTCINLQASQGMLFLNKERIHRRLQESGKPRRGLEHLDLPIPEGRYRKGLADYYSIQHDFPLVYGIGKGGLPNEATPLRKVQAMQLKGYLLFYDQLLANYLAQIGNLRHLFSLQVESKRPGAERHTYFSQDLESVPDLERLFPRHPGKALSDGSILAIPVANDARMAKRLEELRAYPLTELLITDSCKCTPEEIPHFSDVNKSLREIRIRQSIREFHLGDYSLELSRDRNGYLFILRIKQSCALLLVSYQRYKNQDEAREAANFAAFLASRPEYYARRLQQINLNGSQIEYQFNLVFDPAAYSAYLQFLFENEALYLQRREAFLDHLLARFATQFTDYALLRFSAEVEDTSESRQTVEDKSRFLSRIDDLSRDRGRAYDYLQSAWGTENVSGFEKRVSLLAGMKDYSRRHLCKYEVVERFRMEIEDPNGIPWFSSIDTYPSRDKLAEAKRNLLEQLRDPKSYQGLQRRTRDFNPISVGRIFSCVATDENIVVSRYVYALILKGSNGDELRESSKNDYATQPLAWRGISKFIKEIENDSGLKLVKTGPKRLLFIDNRQIQCHVDPIITYKWYRYDLQGEPIATASAPYPSPTAAIQDFAHSADFGDLIVSKLDAAIWSLSIGEEYPPLVSIHAFDNELEAKRAWLRAKSDGQLRTRYQQNTEPGRLGTRITLTTEGSIVIASAMISQQDSLSIDEYIAHCQAEFGRDTEKLKFSTLPTAYGWRLAKQGENALAGDDVTMEGALFFRDVPGAIFGLLDALVAVKDAKNYFAAGSEDNPDYRILLRSSGGPFIATTPSYANAKERNKNLKLVQDRLMRLHPPLEVREEPRLYSWKLCHTTDEQVVLESSKEKVFGSEAAAKTDFEIFIQRIHQEQPASPVGQQVYAIDLKKIEDKYRFVYCQNGPNGEALPLLRSAEEYDGKEVRGKYEEFVKAMAQMQWKKGSLVGKDVPTAVLDYDSKENRASVDRILAYRMPNNVSRENSVKPKWIYRLLDRDNPIAKSKKSYPTREDAEKEKNGICGYKPCREYEPCPKKDIVRVICPALDPGKYHYALFLGTKDKNEVECATLISYMGYTSEDAARKAGEENWLALIERAEDKGNYGDDNIIAVKEAYAESTGSECDKAGIHRAVKPEGVKTEDAVTRAKCYPIRITYKKDDKGNPTLQVLGFHFQGYDEKTDTSLWRSTIDYKDVDQALVAYQLFLTVLGNIESCRIECDEGCYRIHLVEILAESKDFETEAEAWGDMPKVTENECGRSSCPAQGVRLFDQTATSETAFVPVLLLLDGDYYRFEVVAKEYVLAKHSCEYPSRKERDEAIKGLCQWAKDGRFDFSYLPDPKIENLIRQNGFLQFNLGKGYFLRSFKALPNLQESDAQKIVDDWLWLASSSRNYRWHGYDLGLMLADATCGLLDEGKNLVIVALVSNNLHIRIFDSKGEKVVDKAEHELVSGAPLEELKKCLKPLPDQSKLPLKNKREIIDMTISIADYIRGEKEYTNKWYLVNPLESNSEIATIEHENDSVDIEAFNELVRAYPVYKKNDGYRFRLYYPENGSRLDDELRICGCHDADDGKQQALQSFCDQVYIYESTGSYPCRAAAENAFKRFLDLLAEFDNYKDEEETGLGTFSFSIIDREKVLASHPYNHPDRTSAMRAEERVRACVGDEGMHLVEHILLRPQTGAHCDHLLPVCTEFDSSSQLCTLEWQEDLDPDDPCSEENNQKLTYVPGADPYSFWATVVLPSWTERFRNSENRHFFRQMLYREVPAMVALNIIWLGPRQMYEFEKAFKSWLSSRHFPSALCQSESDPFCCMVNFIGKLCSEPLCPDPDTIAATCDCINCKLHLMSVASTANILNKGRNLVIVALVDTKLHIRIFDVSGKRVIDKAENDLANGNTLKAFKEMLSSFSDKSRLSYQQKQNIIHNATSLAGYTLNNEGMVPDNECIETSESLFWLPCKSGEIPKIIECEATDVAEITNDNEVFEGSVFMVDVAAIRRTITERTEALNKYIRAVDFAPVRSMKSYDRINHFLKNPATLDAFKQLHAQMMQDISQIETRAGKLLTNVYQIAFWYLLDHLVQEHPYEIQSVVKEALPQLLHEMEAKGLVLDELAKGWMGEVFGELFGATTAKIVNEYLTLIK
ncbi:MAG: hypothetical protein NTV43_14275 [Methylococcales bacterium]|nr:hypothetical protein [Methylococcales bacterium]